MLITLDPLFIVLRRFVNHNKIAYYMHAHISDDDDEHPPTHSQWTIFIQHPLHLP